MGHFYCLCVLISHTNSSTLKLLHAAEPHKAPQPFQMDTQLYPCASGHSTGWVPHFILMPWTAPTQNFFLENWKQQTQCFKVQECTWFKAFIEAQTVTGITQILSPRRCQEHSANLGRSFSVTNTKANKNQTQKGFQICPQNHSCETLQRHVKTNILESF